MSDKGVKRYSISMIREIQVETVFFLPIRLEWWWGYKEGAYLNTLGGNICTVGLEVKCRYITILICIIELLGTGA